MKFSTAISSAAALAGVATATPNYGGGDYGYGNNYKTVTVTQYKYYPTTVTVNKCTPTPYNGGYNNGYNNGGKDYNNGGGSYNNNGGSYGSGSYGGGYNNGGSYGGKTHYVTVGSVDGKTLAYYPPYLNAKRGDTVSFEFLAKNHTVTQSDFLTPCTAKDGGFKTGFVPNLMGNRPGPKKTFTVTDDSKPLWFYCGQKQPKPHCGGGNAMVFAINPPQYGNTFEKFAEKARAVAVPAPAA